VADDGAGGDARFIGGSLLFVHTEGGEAHQAVAGGPKISKYIFKCGVSILGNILIVCVSSYRWRVEPVSSAIYCYI
jgi:hypothetical protein